MRLPAEHTASSDSIRRATHGLGLDLVRRQWPGAVHAEEAGASLVAASRMDQERAAILAGRPLLAPPLQRRDHRCQIAALRREQVLVAVGLALVEPSFQDALRGQPLQTGREDVLGNAGALELVEPARAEQSV